MTTCAQRDWVSGVCKPVYEIGRFKGDVGPEDGKSTGYMYVSLVCVCVCECWKGGGKGEGGVCYTRKTMPAALRSRMMLRYTCMNVNQRFRRVDFVETAGLFLAVVRPYVVDASSATDQRRSCSWKGGFPVLVQVLLLDIHILSSKVL